MSPIDLKDFALKEQKLPKKFLSSVSRDTPISTWKILGAHFLDFLAISFFTSFSAVVFNQSVKLLMMTKSLKHAFNEQGTISLASSMLPFMIFSYYFLSYFMNHGQTWGMHVFKKRMKMKSQDYRDAFYWAAHSFFLCITGGLFYLAKKDEWQNIKGHDYLYQDMLDHKEYYAINLLERIEDVNKEESVDFAEAA